ncbi:MAG: hypothetical protein ABR87_05680 [Cryomorphaceae bacterium BACL7 MAG-121220-bin83]|nr:MAG: hypothetical protein ABR87_05680 [Cryomorphaceae bacterium BACL7 MAG-121220-bin83]
MAGIKRKKLRRTWQRWSILGAVIFILAVVGFRWTANAPVMPSQEKEYALYVHDTGLTTAEVLQSFFAKENLHSPAALEALNALRRNPIAQRGHYTITAATGRMQLLRKLEFGYEDPVWLRMRGYQSREDIAEGWVAQFDYPKDSAMKALEVLGFEQLVPNSYQVYWSYAPEALVEYLQRAHAAFWNAEREGRAAHLKLSPREVVILASIVQAETKQAEEWPRVAALYLSRLHMGKRLEADPTAVFAYKQVYPNTGVIRRVTHVISGIDHPYNTYRNKGLPPGALATVEPQVVDAVLSAQPNGELYMCADPQRPGFHVFARTYSAHLQNAARYHASLNRRGIRR